MATKNGATKTYRPIRIAGYTATMSAAGFLGYVHYNIVRDDDSKQIGGGGISRLNYLPGARGDKQHRADIKKMVMQAVAEDRAALAKRDAQLVVDREETRAEVKAQDARGEPTGDATEATR